MKKNQGITLIALVITIIVMLILVAVTITIAVNGGLFDYAKKAAADTNTRIEEEQEFANIPNEWSYENLIDKYTTGQNNSTGDNSCTISWIITDPAIVVSGPTSVIKGETLEANIQFVEKAMGYLSISSISMGGVSLGEIDYSFSGTQREKNLEITNVTGDLVIEVAFIEP